MKARFIETPEDVRRLWQQYLETLEGDEELVIRRPRGGLFDMELFLHCARAGGGGRLLAWSGQGLVESGVSLGDPDTATFPQAPVPDLSWLSERRPALLLDRDGVINRDKGYVFRAEDVELMPEVVELISRARQANWRVCVLTNQSGVFRGFYKEEDVLRLHEFMGRMLAEQGAAVDGWFYCPDDPRSGSLLRKPKPGMALEAEAAFPIHRLASVMVGDKLSDRLELPGLRTLLLQGNYDLGDAVSYKTLGDICRELFKVPPGVGYMD